MRESLMVVQMRRRSMQRGVRKAVASQTFIVLTIRTHPYPKDFNSFLLSKLYKPTI